MHIVDHCNLNCNCCNHFSPIADPWFIELEDFKNQLINLKNNVLNIKNFLILGGEPALHPQLFEICMAAREILGNEVYIDVITNGTIINKIAEHKEEYLKANINFNFSSYYNKTKYNEIEKLKPLGRVYNTRILSKQTLVEPSGSLDPHNNFFNCILHKLPCFTLKNNKLYICPFTAHLEHFCKKFNEHIPEIPWDDYLPVEEIKGNMDLVQKFIFTPKNLCRYCNPCADSFPYADSKQDYTEFTVSKRLLYFKDYNRYEECINAGQNNLINWALDRTKNPGRVDEIFERFNFKIEKLRYGNGKIDIIIPYYNETYEQLKILKEELKSQTIINDCVIYLISDNSNMDMAVLSLFEFEEKLHCVFLRNTSSGGPGVTRNKGILNSYNKYILFFDADSGFENKDSLEQMYNKIASNNLNLLLWNAHDSENCFCQKGICVNREILNTYNLLYKPFYFGEDNEFLINLISKVAPEKLYDFENNDNNIYTRYNISSGLNITKTFAEYDNLHFSLITAGFIGYFSAINEVINPKELQHYLIKHISRILHLLDDEHYYMVEHPFVKNLISFSLNKAYQYDKDLINSNLFKQLIILFNINLNEYDIEYLYNYIENNYCNDPKLKHNAFYYLNILKGENNVLEKI